MKNHRYFSTAFIRPEKRQRAHLYEYLVGGICLLIVTTMALSMWLALGGQL